MQSNSKKSSPLKSSRNLFRERSLSSLPSRQLSVMDIMQRRESTILSQNRQHEQSQGLALAKDHEISKLRKNLQTVLSTALNERLQNSKSKEEIASQHHHKQYLQNKIKLFDKQNAAFKTQISSIQGQREQLSHRLQMQIDTCNALQQEVEEKTKQLAEREPLYAEIEQYKYLLKDIEPLKNRIITLEQQVRAEKIKRQQSEKQLKTVTKQKQQIQAQLSLVKPKEQELRQRIAYFQRVNLDLQRKMQDYNRRENDYIKNMASLKGNLTRVTADRNQYKTIYEQTFAQLQLKQEQHLKLTEQFQQRLQIIQDFEKALAQEKQTTISLKQELQSKVVFYQQQGEENDYLKQRNKMLQEIELQLRRVIEAYIKVAEEVNLTIVQRCEQLKKAKLESETYRAQLTQLETKFQKFDSLMSEGSERSYNQIREGFYSILRVNNDYAVKFKEMQNDFNEKIVIMGQQRDILQRNKTLRSIEPPTDQTQYMSIFHQKTQALLLLQNSNDQLLKVKKDLQAKIEELQGLLEREKKEMNVLKLKTADMFRAKHELDEARKKMERYQEMIKEQNEVAADMQTQMSILRQKNAQLNEKHFVLEMDKRNLEVKIQEINQIIKQLDVTVLESKKQTNQKNSHLITDSIQKLQSAVKSLAFFFSCAFCGELPLNPVTLALCGHTYCTKCKQAYTESCYECDTGMPIEKAFQNRFLKDASGKYKFLTMVLTELKTNFVRVDL